ncbi:hypothetical protein [Methanoculleus chikugoensis]|uniref:trehalose-phosphatase n=1 Tax=Methanoculleus chikugoensis TaxID=118126 RepID=UPI001FB27EDA|nr:trehalose-phosphatase [Methanoculleus chikugoensis]
MVPFASRPQKAVPGDVTREVLTSLSRTPGNEVVVISGRDRSTLDTWFGGAGYRDHRRARRLGERALRGGVADV